MVEEPMSARNWKGFSQYAAAGIIVESAKAGQKTTRAVQGTGA